MPISNDLRERVLAAVDERAEPIECIAKRFLVGERTIYAWLKLRKETGDIKPRPNPNKGHSHTITDWVEFEKFAAAHAHLTSPAMCVEWEKIYGRRIAKSVMKRALQKIGYTFKKNNFAMKNQTNKRAPILYESSIR
jgi:transposase